MTLRLKRLQSEYQTQIRLSQYFASRFGGGEGSYKLAQNIVIGQHCRKMVRNIHCVPQSYRILRNTNDLIYIKSQI